MKPIVTISRAYGAGGRIVGETLAKKLGVKYYDKEMLERAVKDSGFASEIVEGAELKAKSNFAYNLSSALGFSEGISQSPLSINEKLFLATYRAITEIAEEGNGGVIVGRCADYVLRDVPNVTNVFIYGETEDRVKRVMDVYGETEKKAREDVASYDKARQNYYNYHTGRKWGDYKNYNLSINSSYISEEEIANLIMEFVEKRNYR